MEIDFNGDMATKASSVKKTKVKVIRIDDLNLEKLDIMKIDVEGFETDVLSGARNTLRKFRPRIILETHTSVLKKSCIDYLRNEGYFLKYADREVLPKNTWMDSIQNLFFLPVVENSEAMAS